MRTKHIKQRKAFVSGDLGDNKELKLLTSSVTFGPDLSAYAAKKNVQSSKAKTFIFH